jgi:hypothetical protein
MMGVLCSLARGGPRGDRAKSIAVAIAAGMNTARVHRHRLREKDKEGAGSGDSVREYGAQGKGPHPYRPVCREFDHDSVVSAAA